MVLVAPVVPSSAEMHPPERARIRLEPPEAETRLRPESHQGELSELDGIGIESEIERRFLRDGNIASDINGPRE